MGFDNEVSYLIDKVYVSKLWNKYNISCDFDKNINIFIGINGSYKTTFIMLIYNLLTLDFSKLIDIDFEYIEIKMRNAHMVKSILFSKSIQNNNEILYTFRVSGYDEICFTKQELKFYDKAFNDEYEDEDNYRIKNTTDSMLKSRYSNMREQLFNLINIDYLNINRNSHIKNRFPYFDDENESIDSEIKKLVRLFIRYQSEIKTSINNYSNEFFKESFDCLLKSNAKHNKISFNSKILMDYKESLKRMSNNNNFSGIDFQDAIRILDDTNNIIVKNIEQLKSNKVNSENLSLQDLVTNLKPHEVSKLLDGVLSFPKFQNLCELYKDVEKKKAKIENPTNTFMKISNNFLKSSISPNKKLVIADDGSLMLQIDEGKRVHLNKLSSGEKQLIILLLSALLQKGKRGIYITDEPELSLHISWQEKLINALHKINPNIQLIIATHSPDIVAKYENKIKRMEGILK